VSPGYPISQQISIPPGILESLNQLLKRIQSRIYVLKLARRIKLHHLIKSDGLQPYLSNLKGDPSPSPEPRRRDEEVNVRIRDETTGRKVGTTLRAGMAARPAITDLRAGRVARKDMMCYDCCYVCDFRRHLCKAHSTFQGSRADLGMP